ncbi:hypothetical protein [Thermus thalpophilus]|nr:hypothetical protein [Thermus thalpophilus]
MQCAVDLLWFLGVMNFSFALGGAVSLFLRKLFKEKGVARAELALGTA